MRKLSKGAKCFVAFLIVGLFATGYALWMAS